MARDPACIFCKIAAGQIPAAVVYEDGVCISFLDIGPLAKGHLLVIPREHYNRLSLMPANESASVASLLPKLGLALLTVTRAEGFNVLCNEGAAAGQAVGHVHFHLIPRIKGDGLGYRWNAGSYAEGEVDKLASEYRKAVASG